MWPAEPPPVLGGSSPCRRGTLQLLAELQRPGRLGFPSPLQAVPLFEPGPALRRLSPLLVLHVSPGALPDPFEVGMEVRQLLAQGPHAGFAPLLRGAEGLPAHLSQQLQAGVLGPPELGPRPLGQAQQAVPVRAPGGVGAEDGLELGPASAHVQLGGVQLLPQGLQGGGVARCPRPPKALQALRGPLQRFAVSGEVEPVGGAPWGRRERAPRPQRCLQLPQSLLRPAGRLGAPLLRPPGQRDPHGRRGGRGGARPRGHRAPQGGGGGGGAAPRARGRAAAGSSAPRGFWATPPPPFVPPQSPGQSQQRLGTSDFPPPMSLSLSISLFLYLSRAHLGFKLNRRGGGQVTPRGVKSA